MATKRKPKQLGLKLAEKCAWGGAREGAGRKRKSKLRRVDHRARPQLEQNQALHVTWRVLPHVWNLRTHRAFEPMLRGFVAATSRFGVRITRFSVQGNHIHMIVEADAAAELSRAMQGLGIRLARALNKLIGRKGQVFEDRYHARVLRSPREAYNAIRYVMRNHEVHAKRDGRTVSPRPDSYAVGPDDLATPRSLWRRLGIERPPITSPIGWLLRQGWLRGAPRRAAFA